MPRKRKGLSMRKVREILRLHFDAGLSTRQMARSCNIGRSTVGEYVQRARHAGLGWPLCCFSPNLTAHFSPTMAVEV